MNLPEASHFEQPPAGTHTGVCYAFIDLGTQPNEYQGETRMVHQVMLRWELPGELMEDGKPFSIGQFYTWSMSDRAKLRQHLEAWRNAPFTKEDFGKNGKFDTKNLLGKPCTLVVTLSEKGNARVQSVGPKMKNVEVAGMNNDPIYVALEPEKFDPASFDKLSDKMKDIIRRSPEYTHLMSNGSRPRESFTADLDDDIPFISRSPWDEPMGVFVKERGRRWLSL